MSTTLGITGGSLGTGGVWTWYNGSCGGANTGVGSTITVSPTLTTTYYVRAEGTCNTTTCSNVMITVNDSSILASSVTATPSTICESLSATLGVSGGTLGTSANWYWYIGSCGSSSAGNGSSITVSPTLTTTYYVRAEGVCNTTPCLNVTVTVNDSSIVAGTVTATPGTICESQSTILGVTGGTLGTSARWYWYNGTCGGSSFGNGTSITVSPDLDHNILCKRRRSMQYYTMYQCNGNSTG